MARPGTRAVRPRSRRKPGDERRAELYEAAAKTFHEKGYNAASLQDIAEQLGILKGSLYYYIQSKEDLLYDLITAIQAEGLEVVTAAAKIDGDPLDRLHNVIVAHVTHTCRTLSKTSVYLHERDALPPKRRKDIRGSEHAHEAVFSGLIAEGQQAGLVRADVDPKIAMRSILGSINWTYRWFTPKGALRAAKLAEQLADLNVRSIAVPEALSHRG